MSDYDNVGKKIGELKLAAIDALMYDYPGCWQVDGNRYKITGGDAWVSRPGPDGNGGGDHDAENFIADIFGVDRDPEFRKAFDQVRSTIDGIMAPWLQLPNPGSIAPEVESMRQANRSLALSTLSNSGTVSAAGKIDGYLAGVQANSTAMSGLTIEQFKAKFLLQLRSTIANNHAVTVVLGGALAAQEKLWEDGRQTVADAVREATKAFQARAKGADIGWDIVIKAAGWALKGVGLFATGPAKLAIEGAGLGLEILKDTTGADKPKADPPGGDYKSIMEGFKKAMQKLDDTITAEERTLRDNLIKNKGVLERDRGAYDLTKPAILDIEDDSQAKIVVITPSLVQGITDVYLPEIAGELENAAKQANEATTSTPYIRDGSIGLGYYGPWTELYELTYMLYELLNDLAWEVKSGAHTLKLIIEDMGQTDSDAADALEQNAKKLKEGSGYNPWDNGMPDDGGYGPGPR